ncbi:unnamed protein product [Phytophthora lilii]|uniref:Unnamed protein product n=1 Tax=Phytophthora lilii TaxID=2077276 RepID=A0A9W6TML7_9STRA|nr:unnamed protein product [Phytophthora lilii]
MGFIHRQHLGADFVASAADYGAEECIFSQIRSHTLKFPPPGEIPESGISTPEERSQREKHTNRHSTTGQSKTTNSHPEKTAMLDSLLHRFFAPGSSDKQAKAGKPGEQVSQETAFTREADVEGWVFLAEERHSEPGSKTRSYADVVAGRT